MRAVIALTMAVATAGAILAVAAPSPAQIADGGVEDERERLVAAKTSAGQALARAARLERDAADARDRASAARAREAAVAARIRAREAEIAAAEARVAILAALQRRQAGVLAAQQGPLVRLMAALQSLTRRPAAAAIARPGTITDLVHVRATLATVLPVIRARTEGVRGELERARQLRAGGELAVTALADSRRRLDAERAGLATLERRNADEARRLAAGAMYEQDRAIALGEDARDIVDLMDQMETDADLGARLAALAGPVVRPPVAEATPAPAPTSAPYRLPVAGRIVTGLGELADGGVRSRGLTLAVPPGAPVHAPAAGTIAFAGAFRRYGDIIVIDHGAGWTSLVTGIDQVRVASGGRVAAGAPLGTAAGARPRVTVELRRNGRPVDIARLIG